MQPDISSVCLQLWGFCLSQSWYRHSAMRCSSDGDRKAWILAVQSSMLYYTASIRNLHLHLIEAGLDHTLQSTDLQRPNNLTLSLKSPYTKKNSASLPGHLHHLILALKL